MDDLISRQVAIDTICEDGLWLGSQGCTDITLRERQQRDVGILSELPTIEAIPISFIENRITELAKERNKYEIGTSNFRYVDMQIYYYEMLMEEWKGRTDENN